MRGAGDRRARRRRATECEVPSGSGWRRRWWMAHPRETLARGARTYFRSALLNNSRFAASDGLQPLTASSSRGTPSRRAPCRRRRRATTPASTGHLRRSFPLDEPVGADDRRPRALPSTRLVTFRTSRSTPTARPRTSHPRRRPPAAQPPRRVRTPELKLRRPAPKNLTFWTRPRTPSPSRPPLPPSPSRWWIREIRAVPRARASSHAGSQPHPSPRPTSVGHAIDGSRARPEGRAREFRRRVRDGRVRRAILRDHPPDAPAVGILSPRDVLARTRRARPRRSPRRVDPHRRRRG